jgi:hypothetical protein
VQAATKLGPSQFAASHPIVWNIQANSAQLFTLFERTLSLQYDAYEQQARPKLRLIALVRGPPRPRPASPPPLVVEFCCPQREFLGPL